MDKRLVVNKVSIVIPVYNSSATIGQLVEDLFKELMSVVELEVVLVNDGSPSDNSADICADLANSNNNIKFLNLSMNFGEHNAVMAGLNYCTGDCAVIMDDDFQNPPSELIDKLNNGYDVVFSKYRKKKHSLFRNLGSFVNDVVAGYVVNKPSGLYLSSFKIINRFLIDQIIQYTGPYPYIDGLIFRITQNYSTIFVEHRPRVAGESGYTLSKLISLWLNMLTNFSIIPLRIATIMGFIFAFIGIVLAIYFIISKYIDPSTPVGWSSLIVSIFIISSIQMFAIGMIGEYLGRLFIKSNGNPQFVIKSTINCEK